MITVLYESSIQNQILVLCVNLVEVSHTQMHEYGPWKKKSQVGLTADILQKAVSLTHMLPLVTLACF